MGQLPSLGDRMAFVTPNRPMAPLIGWKCRYERRASEG